MRSPKKPKSSKEELQEYLHEQFERLYFEEELLKKKASKKKRKGVNKPKKEKLSKFEEKILEDLERVSFETELEEEFSFEIEKIIKEEFEPVDYESVNPEDLRYKGEFISPEFNDMILNIGKASNRHPQDVLDNPRFEHLIDGLLQDNKMTTYKTVPALTKYLLDSGKEFITVVQNGVSVEMSVDEVSEFIATMEQTVRANEEVVYIGLLTVHRLDGEIIVYLPEDSEDFEGIWEFLNSDKSEYLIYEPK